MPDPFAPQTAPIPPEAPEMGAFPPAETEKGKGETSSPLYRTSSDAYLIASDKDETDLGGPRLSSDKEQTKIGSYLISPDKERTTSDKDETEIGSYLDSSDKEQNQGGKEAEEKGKEENSSSPPENRPAPVMRGRRTLPASPVERARLEAQSGVQQNELNDRSTQVAFALLFVVPILIILLSVLLFLPFISRQMSGDDDPSGVRVQPATNGQAPSR